MSKKKPVAADVAVTLAAAAEIETGPGVVRRFPAGWTGRVTPAARDALAEKGALQIDAAPEAMPEEAPAEE